MYDECGLERRVVITVLFVSLSVNVCCAGILRLGVVFVCIVEQF